MKLRIFQSDKGDCLLISNNGANILIDGGMGSSYTQHVSKFMEKLRKKSEDLDLVCVSHIDDDHISGILKMVEDEVDWRVFEHHQANGTAVPAPKSLRPVKIKEIWHNAFNEIVDENVGDIENILATTASILSASSDINDIEQGGLAYSIGQAIQLSRRLKPEQLNIPLNKRFNGKLAMFRPGQQSFTIGGLKISVIAPFGEDLAKLRKDWNKWLHVSQDQLDRIKDRVGKDEGMLGNTTGDLGYFIALSKALGDRSAVTPPNLASIMFLVEDGTKTLLMTGDGHSDDIRKGLVKIGKLDETKGLHVDVLKVQHHGSEHNIDPTFCQLITADDYIFCGDGFKENPEIKVIDAIIKSRTSSSAKIRAITGSVGNKFTLWFNSSKSLTSASRKAHMEKIEKFVKNKANKNPKIKFRFMSDKKSFFEMTV